jgi:hypothetical protein
MWCASFGWDHLFSFSSILLLGAFSLSWIYIAAIIVFSVKVKVLGGRLWSVVGRRGYRRGKTSTQSFIF